MQPTERVAVFTILKLLAGKEGISQIEIAKRTDLSYSAIWQAIKDFPKLFVIKRKGRCNIVSLSLLGISATQHLIELEKRLE